MATIRVTTQAELLSALKTATGGDTLLLADGNYGEIKLTDTFGSPVTIKAENDQGGVSAPVTVDLVAVDDICTTGEEGSRPAASTVVTCPSP